MRARRSPVKGNEARAVALSWRALLVFSCLALLDRMSVTCERIRLEKARARFAARASFRGSSRSFEALVAFAVVAAALLDPFQPAISIGRLVGIVLIEAAMHTRLAGAFLRIFGTDGDREDRRTAGQRRCRRRRGRLGFGLLRGRRGGRSCRSRRRRRFGCALRLAEVIPFHAVESAGGFGSLIFRAAFLHGESLRRRTHRQRGKT